MMMMMVVVVVVVVALDLFLSSDMANTHHNTQHNATEHTDTVS